MKKFLVCVMIMMFTVSAEGYGTFSGEWNIYGEGFVEKSFVRMSLEISGSMNVSACPFSELPPSVVNVMSDDWETVISRDEVTGLYTLFDCMTGLEMDISVYASELGVKIYDNHMPNEIIEPYLFLDFIPSFGKPLELPEFEMNGMNIQITLTSENAGKVHIRGNINTSYAGEFELNTECVIWKKGTERPNLNSSSSGCNSGMGVFTLMILLAGVKKFVWN